MRKQSSSLIQTELIKNIKLLFRIEESGFFQLSFPIRSEKVDEISV